MAAEGRAAPELAAGCPDWGPGGQASRLHRAWAGTPASPRHPQCRLRALEPQRDTDRPWPGPRAASASPCSVSLKVLTLSLKDNLRKCEQHKRFSSKLRFPTGVHCSLPHSGYLDEAAAYTSCQHPSFPEGHQHSRKCKY